MRRIGIFASTLLALQVTLANTTDAIQQYHSGNFTAASEGLTALASKNNAEALFYLANMYLNGYGVRKDFTKGLEVMTRAAELKYLPAQMYLGNYYFQDKHDVEKALIWYRKAADGKNVGAQMFTALCYLNGYGSKKLPDTGQKYIIMAALNGIPMAQYELAKMFLASKHSGNQKMGKIWLIKAANAHYADAEYTLATMLATGDKIEQDPSKAQEWLQQAAHDGSQPAKDALAKIAPNTSPTPTAPLTTAQQWQALTDTLKKAAIVLQNSPVITSADSITLTPVLVSMNKSAMVQPNLNLLMPNAIPLQKIITYMMKLNYQQAKPKFYITEYSFKLPPDAQNYQQALQILKRDALHNYPPSLFALGQMYDQGIEVNKNTAKAFELFSKAAELNYLKAQYLLGLYYLQGRAGEKNYPKAVEWLTKAALRGSDKAQLVLGNLLEYGINNGSNHTLAKNPMQAAAMYNLAASNGLTIAEYRLADLYASGMLNPTNNDFVEKENLARAFVLYKKAVARGIAEAEIPLAYFYAQENQPLSIQDQAFQFAQHADHSPTADMLLAILYDRGIGTAKSPRQALKFLKRLSNEQNSLAEFMLGTYYLNDSDTRAEGIGLLQKAAGQNNGYALYNLAILTQKNLYQKPGENFISLLTQAGQTLNQANLLLADYYLANTHDAVALHKALNIYQQLADKQDANAELKLGIMNEQGIALRPDIQKALQWYQKSAEHGNRVAQYLLGNLYQIGQGVNRDADKAIEYYTKSAEQNYLPAEVALGFLYEMDKHNYSTAKLWYEKAAEKNNPQALYNLGLIYQYGKGTKIDYDQAHKLYDKAAKQGFAPAQMQLAELYLQGSGVSADPTSAFTWYQKAAEKNNCVANYQLGMMSELGVGHKADFTTAREYYEKSAAGGNPKAQIALARFYEFGLGVTADKNKSIDYYRQASEKGNAYAQWKLTHFNGQPIKANTAGIPQYCVENSRMENIPNSFWKRVANNFNSKSDVAYLNAVDALNAGDISQGSAALLKILTQDPSFTSAKTIISYYLCPTA